MWALILLTIIVILIINTSFGICSIYQKTWNIDINRQLKISCGNIDCISQHDYDIGLTKAITLEVNTPSDFFDRFKRQPQRRYSPEDQEIIDKWIQLNLHYGILSPSKSRIGSPVHVVKKMGKKHRPVCDYRELDKHIECPNLPYICIQGILERLGNANIFKVVDLTQSFYSIEVKPSDREKLAIQTQRYIPF